MPIEIRVALIAFLGGVVPALIMLGLGLHRLDRIEKTQKGILDRQIDAEKDKEIRERKREKIKTIEKSIIDIMKMGFGFQEMVMVIDLMEELSQKYEARDFDELVTLLDKMERDDIRVMENIYQKLTGVANLLGERAEVIQKIGNETQIYIDMYGGNLNNILLRVDEVLPKLTAEFGSLPINFEKVRELFCDGVEIFKEVQREAMEEIDKMYMRI